MTPVPDPYEFEIALLGMRIKAKGFLAIMVTLIIVMALLFKTDLSALSQTISVVSQSALGRVF